MYSVGDMVEYKTAKVKYKDGGESGGITRIGKISEAFHTVDKHPCYWIDGEKELILHSQIRRKCDGAENYR